jgi:hypothetical protein
VSEKVVKKGSELLVEIDHKLDILLGIVRNQDLLLKTLNNKIGKINVIQNSTISNTNGTNTDSNIEYIKPIEYNKPLLHIDTGTNNNSSLISDTGNIQHSQQKKELVSDDEFVQVNTDHFDAEIAKSGGKKVAVQQRVTYDDGKNICLASVEITGDNLKSSKKLKTNAMGKWVAVLEPGNYVVSVTKPGNKNKQNIALSRAFTVPESDKPVELPLISQ